VGNIRVFLYFVILGIKKAFTAAGINMGKVTHASRGVAARKLVDMGVDFYTTRKSKYTNVLIFSGKMEY